MQLFKPEDRLPENGKYVLAHIAFDNWDDEDDPIGVYWTVVKFVADVSEYDDDNNEKPYRWEEWGPGEYFGQGVDLWCELPTIG